MFYNKFHDCRSELTTYIAPKQKAFCVTWSPPAMAMNEYNTQFHLFLIWCHSVSKRFILTNEADDAGRRHCHALLISNKLPNKTDAMCDGFIDVKRNNKADNLAWLNYMFKEKKPEATKWFGYNTHKDADYWLKHGCDYIPTRY